MSESSLTQGVTTTTTFALGPTDEAIASETSVTGQALRTALLGLGPHHDLDYTTDPSGALTGSASYDPWGVPGHDGAHAGSLGFQGDPTETLTGLVDMGARHYLPALGRFLTKDPVTGDLTSPVTLNPYIYAANDPVTKWDPTGMYTQGSKPGSRGYASRSERGEIQRLNRATAVARVQQASLVHYGGRPPSSFLDSFPELVGPSLTRWVQLGGLSVGFFNLRLEAAARLEGKSLYGLTLDQSGPSFRVNVGSGTVTDTEAVKALLLGRTEGEAMTRGWAEAFASWGESITPGGIVYSQRAGVSVGDAAIHYEARGLLHGPAVTYQVRGVETDEGSLSYLIRATFERRLDPVRVPVWVPVGVGVGALALRYGSGVIGRLRGFQFPHPLRAR